MRLKQEKRRPYILAVDTSTFELSMCLVAHNRVLGEWNQSVRKGHSQHLLLQVHRLLALHHLEVLDLDALVIGLGPGSFTGLRIGLAMLKGLSLASGVPLYGSSSLKAMSHNLCSNSPEWIAPCIDARKKQVFGSLYFRGKEVLKEAGWDPKVFAQALAKRDLDKVCMMGSGFRLYREIFREVLGDKLVEGPLGSDIPRAIHLVQDIRSEIDQKHCPDLQLLEPTYLRASDAELEWHPDKAKGLFVHSS